MDFLGFQIRRYANGKLLIKPSKDAVQRIRKRLTVEMRALRGSNADAVIAKLNPIIRGWSAYYRSVVSKTTFFNALDTHMWKLASANGPSSAPEQVGRWVVDRYFGAFHPTRRDRWIFGDRDSGAYLAKFAWTDDRPTPAGQGRRHPTIRAWPTTGPNGVVAANPRWTPPR